MSNCWKTAESRSSSLGIMRSQSCVNYIQETELLTCMVGRMGGGLYFSVGIELKAPKIPTFTYLKGGFWAGNLTWLKKIQFQSIKGKNCFYACFSKVKHILSGGRFWDWWFNNKCHPRNSCRFYKSVLFNKSSNHFQNWGTKVDLSTRTPSGLHLKKNS